jgi:glycosyltransferase involved in cell wall biosynthesis
MSDLPATIPRPIPLPGLPEQPLVSVLVASYNYEHYLGRALGSVLAQTYARWECIVCDDGSTDDSADMAARYARHDERIRLIAQPNGGVASALNRAYQASVGDIICLLDADDFFVPDKLSQVVQGFRDGPDTGMVLHAIEVVDAQERVLYQKPFSDKVEDGWIAQQVVARGGRWRSMPTSALGFRRTITDLLFPIPEETFRSEADGFLYTLAPLLTPVTFLYQPLAGYRLHGANLTGTTQINASVAVRYLDALDRKTDAANKRLAELGVDTRLSAARHLNGIEHRFMQALFAGHPRGDLLRAFVPLAKALLADDLYGPLRKTLGMVANLGAIALPVQHRAAWMTKMLHPAGVRWILQPLRQR